MNKINNIVLVHGAFADGSGWGALYQVLTGKGYNVVVVQNPLTSMEDDVAATNRVLDKLTEPAILVGHSYGGAVITEAGVSDKVAGLVYVAAFQPDAGESALDLVMSAPDLSGGAILPPDTNGFIHYSNEKFHSGFCADIPAAKAAFMAASQIPVHVNSFAAKMTRAAWHTKPTWAIVATADKSINPVIKRRIYERSQSKTTEIAGASHVVFMSHPDEVAAVIEAAATGSLTYAEESLAVNG
jgi:pimeloyl-ACP methyl ester carboxylesterase